MVAIKRRMTTVTEAEDAAQQTVQQDGAQNSGNSDSQNGDENAESEAQKAAEEAEVKSIKDSIATELNGRQAVKKTYDDVRRQATLNINQLKEKDVADPSADNKGMIVKEYNRIRQAKTAYEDAIRKSETNVITLNQKLAAANADIDDNIVESMKISYASKLFEAVSDVNRTSVLADIIRSSFDGLSFQPDMTQCRTIAKNAIGYMNREGWADGSDHWDKFSEFVFNVLHRSIRISVGANEETKFMESLKNGLMSNAVFAWSVFGKTEPVEGPVEPSASESSESVENVDNGPWIIDDVDESTVEALADDESYGDLIDNGSVEFVRNDENDKYSVIIRGSEDLANEISLFVEGMER